MGFGEAIQTCFSKYATFTGRAPRSEYWWFWLFGTIVGLAGDLLDIVANTNFVSWIVALVLLLPNIAVSVRRLHDIDRTGWWLLIIFVPLIGWIVLLVWACTRGSIGTNRYGPDPLPALGAAAA